MAAVVQNGHVVPTPPPTDKKLEVKDKLSLILEVLWFNLLILPAVLLHFFRKIFPPPGKSLRGQVVIVTGAGRGLGRGLALGFAKEGCKVAVADVNRPNALETAADIVKAGGTAKAYFTNVAKVDEVKDLRTAVTEDLGPVDILVHNAGLIYGEPIEDSPVETIEAVIAVNLTSHFYLVKEFLPAMRERNSGHIVAMGSAGGLAGFANASAYIACKFGVIGFMESVRAELRANPNNNVKTTTVLPYFINTSAQYVEHWDLRLPPISIEEVVDATISGVKREEVTVTVPDCLYSLVHIGKLLPQFLVDKAADIFHASVLPPSEKVKESSPNLVIIKDLTKKRAVPRHEGVVSP